MKIPPHFILCGLVAGILGSMFVASVTNAVDPNPAETLAPATSAAPTGMTVRFELFVKDTHASADFYTRILGFQCDTDAGPYIQARSGSVHIGICDQANLPESHHFSPQALQGRKGVGTEIVLEVENLDAYYERVTKSGYAIREALAKRPWGLRDFRLVDPDGYYLRITEKKE
jgi:uncharacterized glyoxalase superfamily protein PhnB